jgi:3-methyladenine DNA glycosylase AlkD
MDLESTSSSSYKNLRQKFRGLADSHKAELASRFFKTGKGDYAEGDQFLGIPVPQIRKFIKVTPHLSIENYRPFLTSSWHEERMLGLLFLVQHYKNSEVEDKASLYSLYLGNFEFINNWDLVDATAEHIVGAHLAEHSNKIKILRQWAESEHLWTRRIAMVSTFYDLRRNSFEATLHIAKLLLKDDHDLIHKAVGWLLREVGKRDFKTEEAFLLEHYPSMPRTMLRYAIEKFPEPLRQKYLKGLH